MSDSVERVSLTITPEQLKEWRELMMWSEGDGALDPETVLDLLDEVDRLQRELATARRRLALRSASGERGIPQ